jgi:type I restriction enzyme S subunit
MPYIRFFLSSSAFQNQINVAKSGVAISHFGPTHLRKMQVVAPPRQEQESIVAYLETALQQYSSTIEKADHELTLIHEYRTRLVADVVTGKLDVREAAAHLPEEIEPVDAEEPIDDEGSIGDEMDEELEEREQKVDA